MNGRVTKVGVVIAAILASSAWGQMGRRWAAEKKVVPDPVTGIPLTFLTTDPAGDSKIYPTHPQWTADDHIHPTFSRDSTRIEVQCALLAPDNRALDLCVVPVPKSWRDRTEVLPVSRPNS